MNLFFLYLLSCSPVRQLLDHGIVSVINSKIYGGNLNVMAHSCHRHRLTINFQFTWSASLSIEWRASEWAAKDETTLCLNARLRRSVVYEGEGLTTTISQRKEQTCVILFTHLVRGNWVVWLWLGWFMPLPGKKGLRRKFLSWKIQREGIWVFLRNWL